MILADKIIELRKKNGWSQEELADKMNVTRQSVSKWEGAQSVPDLQKILQMGQLFGVTTDYLLKEELGETEYIEPVEDRPEVRRVSLEEANEFLRVKRITAKYIALATFLCIMSPLTLILLSALSELGESQFSAESAAGIGLVVLLLTVAAAVAIFIFSGAKTSHFEYLEKEVFETEYGVTGRVKELKEQYKWTYTRHNVLGTCICILSVVPLFIGVFASEQEMYMIYMLTITFTAVGIGVMFFIVGGINWSSLQKLLQEGDYTKKKKKHSKFAEALGTAYWLVAAAIYLAYSFAMEDWGKSWIIWPVAGVLYPAVMAGVSVWKE